MEIVENAMEKPTLTPPAVHCTYKELKKITDLVPHPQNPNQHPPKQIELLIAILQYSGNRNPVVVSTRSGFVVKGHGRIKAYQEAGWEEIPVDYQDYESDEQELADLVADNEIAKMAEMNTGKLQEISVQLDSGAFNMQLLGIPEAKLEKLMTTVRTPPPQLSGVEGAPLSESSESDLPAGEEGAIHSEGPATHSHVRMVQLFFTEETQQEFMHIIEFFQENIGTDNVTDTTLEVLRAAFRSHQEASGEATETDTPDEASSEG